MEELTQEEILALELAAGEAQAELDAKKTRELLQSDEVYQSTVNRIQNDSQLSNAQKKMQIEQVTFGRTKELKKKQEPLTKDHDYFYGDLKSDDGTPLKPAENLGVFNMIKAGLGDFSQLVGFSEDDNEAQIRRAELAAQDAEYIAAGEAEKAKYPTTKVPWWATSNVVGNFVKNYSEQPAAGIPVALANTMLNEENQEISVYYEVDENNEVKMTRIPAVDSSVIERAIDSGARRIVTSIGGLVEREDDVLYVEGDDLPEGKKIGDVKEKGGLELNITEQSDLEKRIPELDMGGGEGFLADMISFGIPAIGGYKAFKTVAGAGKLAAPAIRAYAGGSIGAAMAQAIVTTEGDSTLLVRPETIKSVFPNLEEETLNDISMILDSFIVDGVFDVALYPIAKTIKFGTRRVKGLRGAVDSEWLTRTVREGTLLNTLVFLDPKLKELGGKEFIQNVRQLATVLNNNADLHLTIGNTKGKVPLDTVNALSKGAEAYVTVTNQKLKNGMGDGWDAFVKKEATEMVQRMIDIQRSVPENVSSRLAQVNMFDGVSTTLAKAGDDITPDGFTINDAADELVDLRKSDTETAAFETNVLNDQVDTLAAQTDQVFAENPVIKKMLDGVDPKQLLDETTELSAIIKLFGEDGADAYRKTWKEVENAYLAIPNTPLDQTQLKMLREKLSDVVTEIDPLKVDGKDNRKVSSILAEIRSVFKPKEIDVNSSQFDSPEAAERFFSDTMPREGGNSRLQTADEVLGDLEGTIGFQDLYRLKQKLEQMIKAEQPGSGVAEKLIQLKKHITAKEGGQLGYMLDMSDGATAAAAINADRTFTGAMSKWMDSPFMQRYSDMLNQRVNRGDNIPVVLDNGLPVGESNLITQAPNLAKEVVNDPTGRLFKDLELAMGGDVSKPILDYYISQATIKMAKALKNPNRAKGRLDYVAIQDSFNSISQQLKNNNSPLFADLQKAINDIDAVQVDLGSKTLAADELLKKAQLNEAALETSILDEFVSDYNKGASQSKPAIVIGDLLTGKDGGNAMEALLTEINRLPDGPQKALVLKSVQSSAIKQVNAKVFGSSPIGLSAPDATTLNTKLGRLSKITQEELDGTLDALRVVFKDDPFVIEGYEQALRELVNKNQLSKTKSTVAGVGSDTIPNLKIADSVQGGILLVGGYMNPVSAAMRRGSAQQVENMTNAAKEVGQETLGMIVSNPREFARIAKLYAQRARYSDIEIAIRELVTSAGYAAKFDLRTEDENEQTESVFGSTLSGGLGGLETLYNGLISIKDIAVGGG